MVIIRRPDLDMTDEEFKEYLDKSISDEDIRLVLKIKSGCDLTPRD